MAFCPVALCPDATAEEVVLMEFGLNSAAVDDIIECKGKGQVTSFRRRGTSSMEQSSSVRHRLLVSRHLQKISQDLFVFTVTL